MTRKVHGPRLKRARKASGWTKHERISVKLEPRRQERKFKESFLEMAEAAVPTWVNLAFREDVVQDIAIGLLDGSVNSESIVTAVQDALKAQTRGTQFNPFGPESIDKPIFADSDRTLLDYADVQPLEEIPYKEGRAPKVLVGAWYKRKGHLGNREGRPRSWFHTSSILVSRRHHEPEVCGIGSGLSEKRFKALHATCPNCYGLMHITEASGASFGQRWRWCCRRCDAHVVYVGEKYWPDRSTSPIINGKRSHHRKSPTPEGVARC